MNDEEKRNQKAWLLLEHQEALESLAHLKERGARLSETFLKIGDWLRHQATGQPGRYRHVNSSEMIADYRGTGSAEELAAFLDELEAARHKVLDLERRKTELGLR